VDKPTGSYSSWENTMCNSLAPIGEKTRSAWHDGYASAKTEWQGLTDEEIAEMHQEIKVKGMGAYKTEDIYRAIEAKLKEKNT
jgi:hypothetical protein